MFSKVKDSMRLGFLVRPLEHLDLEQLAEWASKNGYEALEIDARPGNKQIDVTEPIEALARKVKDILGQHDLVISSLGYYVNNLDPDEKKRQQYHQHIKLLTDTCNLLDVGVVCTFVGSVPGQDMDRNIEAVREHFSPLVEYAKDHNVRIAIENCPMVGGIGENVTPFAPGNIAYCPQNWDRIFDEVGLDNLGLNLDPSHLCWQQIDYVEVARQYGNRVYHVHAKDTEFVQSRMFRAGILHDKSGLGSSTGTWRFRMPGWGAIDWPAFISALAESGYDYVISVEHEDPIFAGLGAEEGLKKTAQYLKQYVIRERAEYGGFIWAGKILTRSGEIQGN